MQVAAFLIAFVLTALLVPLVGLAVRTMGLAAKPSAARWHSRSVPQFGGVAMLAGLFAVLWTGGILPGLWPMTLCTVLMFSIGLVDDLRPIGPTTKMILQMSAAGVFLYLLPPISITGQPVVDLLLELLWMVGITNAFNLLDNMDGLAGGVATIAGAFFLIVLKVDGGPALAGLSVAVAAFVGTALGFLLYNFKPASIFMGDSGSHLMGSFVAGATLMALPQLKAHVAPVGVIPVVLLLIPIFDTAFVTVTRLLAGRSAFIGGRDHTSHRLVALGLGERRAVMMLYGLTLAGGAAAVGFQTLAVGTAWGLAAIYIALLGIIGVYLGHIETTKNGQELALPPLPSELTHRYRIYEVLIDAALVSAAYYLAFLARFREPELSQVLPYFATSVPIVACTQLVSLWLSGKYRQVWRTLGPSEMFSLLRGSLAGVGASVVAVLYLDHFEGFSRVVFAFDALLATTFIMLARVGLGALDESLRRRRANRGMALVYGAGRGGALAVRELLQNSDIGLMPVGFIDDDPAKRRLRIEGYSVLGTLENLSDLLAPGRNGITVVIVSFMNLSREKADRVCAICAERGVEVRRFRFSLEAVDPHQRTADVVQFKRG
jgi:UDP-GlcNAc:undecaprenyl-phosphate GlcNAc-1-phosphate transferase